MSAKEPVIQYMKNRQWVMDQKAERKRYLYRMAQEGKKDPDIASKIGSMLIYNQLIEQSLSDIVTMSIHYMKAALWPVSVSLDIDLEKATFGKMIEYFRQYATIEPNRELLLSHLTKFNLKRNIVVHELFDIRDLAKLATELNQYFALADDILKLLREYDDQVCENFCHLERSRKFDETLK